MTNLAGTLSNFPPVGRPVRDATGLEGRFDYQIDYSPRFIPDPVSGSLTPNPDADAGVSIFTAIEEQLALKLQRGRAPVNYVVIDRAEPPTED